MESSERQPGERLDRLETLAASQIQAMGELREHSAQTGKSLVLTVETLDRLAVELERLRRTDSTVQAKPAVAEGLVAVAAPGKIPRAMWMALAGMFLAIVAAVLAWQFLRPRVSVSSPGRGDQTGALSPIDQARQYASAREYAKAEGMYRGILAKNPKDPQAIKGLASALFRQDKIEESANVLRALSAEGTTQPGR